MDVHELKQKLQSFFSDGLVTIVGSGLSCAEGIPGMGALTSHLLDEVPKRIDKSLHAEWDSLATAINKKSLEPALMANPPSEGIEEAIIHITSSLIEANELAVISEVFDSGRELRLSKMLRHFVRGNTPIPIITTNYDRLVEIAVEQSGLGADTLFAGSHAGRLNPRESAASFLRDVKIGPSKAVRYQFQHRAIILKPHGSLDWYQKDGQPVRFALPLNRPRMVITPGMRKYRSGYESPFDTHREYANKEIDRAKRFLVIGYGFNDDHLETHLNTQIASGKETLILTYSLSDNAKDLISKHSNILAICFEEDSSGNRGSRIVTKDEEMFINDFHAWDAGSFVNEVF